MSEPSEKLQYGMLGEDAMSDAEKQFKYTGDVDWSYIEPHFRAGNVVYVDPELDLAKVGLAFSQDDKEKVQTWKKKGDIVIPSIHHAQWWEHDETRFLTLIVHPFVLIQPLAKI